MITSQQMRAARALLEIDQRQLAELADLSLPTIQRMEASDGQVRGVVATLVKVISALERGGIELIGENAPSIGVGRGVRLRETPGGESRKHVPSMLFDQASGGHGSAA
jgi:DNA-binding XRE family transcriptional regulator